MLLTPRRTNGPVRRLEVDRVLTGDEITTPAVDEITTVGTYVAPPPPPPAPVKAPAAPAPAPAVGSGCSSNDEWACVPVASDVDCAGGSGNGPAYVSGPVRIVGSDVYDLDRDGDGITCDA